MRILFFSDKYGYNFMSIKRSIQEELENRGIDVLYQDKGNIKHIVGLVKTLKPDQVWLVHSALMLPCDKSLIEPPVVGFGFSDPHYFSPSRLQSYDAYVTAHHGIYLQYKQHLPILYGPDPYSPQYFKGLELKRDIDATCIGRAMHPRFANTMERVDFINRLREDVKLDIHAYGDGWPTNTKNHGRIEGKELLSIINRSSIGLDLQGGQYSLSERVFHYSGCGVPVITRDGPEVDLLFEKDKEILTYDSYENLREQLMYYSGHPEKLRTIGLMAQKRCLAEHTVQHRVGNILTFMKEVKK